MAIKTTTICIAICVVFGAMAVLPIAEAQGRFINTLLNFFRITGTLFCTANGQIGLNGTSTSTPVFSNAVVQLKCGNGSSSAVVTSGLTNSSGGFSIFLNPITMFFTALLQNCRLVVPTPLSTCNSDLPSFGGLVSALQALGSSIVGLRNVTNVAPTGFFFAQNLNN